MRPPSEVEIGWAAGIIDGEGSVTLDKKGRKETIFRQPAVTVPSTDKEILDELARFFGGNVRPLKRRSRMKKPGWQWKLCGFNSVGPCLTVLEPHLRCPKKRARARHIIQGYPSVSTPNGVYTPEQRTARLTFQDAFYALER